MKKFKNPIIDMSREELNVLIDDFNSDSISKRAAVENLIQEKVCEWVENVNKRFNNILFMSTTGRHKFHQIPVINFGNMYRFRQLCFQNIDSKEIKFQEITRYPTMSNSGTVTINVDDVFDEYFLFNKMSERVNDAVESLNRTINHTLDDIIRYRADIKKIDEMFDVEKPDECLDVITETIRVLKCLGYDAKYEYDDRYDRYVISFTSFGSDNFCQKHKDVVRVLLGGRFDSFEYGSNEQKIYIKINEDDTTGIIE